MVNLLSIVEVGGYPDFSHLYQQSGCDVKQITSLRKAITHIKSSFKNNKPIDIIIAEYNYQTQFRDRTSSIESLMAILQPFTDVKVIVFLDENNQQHFSKVSSRFKIFSTLLFPIDQEKLLDTVEKAIQ